MSKVKIMVNNTTPTLTTLVPSKTSDLINDSDFQTGTQVATALDGKVDKVPDKGLSTNDYTDAEKTKLEKAIIKRTASGNSATFNDGGDDLPIVSLVATISPIQDGSGAPSPTNVRPISGTDQITFYVNDDNGFSVPLERTVYGGTLDAISGVLTVDRYFAENKQVAGKLENESGYFWYIERSAAGIPPISYINAKLICNRFIADVNTTVESQDGAYTFYANGIMRWKEQGALTLAEYRAYLASNPVQICYELATPLTYQLTPHEVNTLLGSNTIYTGNGFPVTVTYRADPSIVIENIVNAITSLGGNV